MERSAMEILYNGARSGTTSVQRLLNAYQAAAEKTRMGEGEISWPTINFGFDESAVSASLRKQVGNREVYAGLLKAMEWNDSEFDLSTRAGRTAAKTMYRRRMSILLTLAIVNPNNNSRRNETSQDPEGIRDALEFAAQTGLPKPVKQLPQLFPVQMCQAAHNTGVPAQQVANGLLSPSCMLMSLGGQFTLLKKEEREKIKNIVCTLFTITSAILGQGYKEDLNKDGKATLKKKTLAQSRTIFDVQKRNEYPGVCMANVPDIDEIKATDFVRFFLSQTGAVGHPMFSEELAKPDAVNPWPEAKTIVLMKPDNINDIVAAHKVLIQELSAADKAKMADTGMSVPPSTLEAKIEE